jgi:methoxymalonate biosynthesis acyl carrier protein
MPDGRHAEHLRRAAVDESRKRIREFFGRFFRTAELGDGDDIFASGYVNSLFAMQLIVWIEKDFDIGIEDSDLHISNFNSVNSIAAFIESKSAAQAAA